MDTTHQDSDDYETTQQAALAKEAQRMMESKIPIEQIMKTFTDRGISEAAATTAIHTASKMADMSKDKVEEKEQQEKSWFSRNWWFIFVAYLIIKYGLRAMSNN